MKFPVWITINTRSITGLQAIMTQAHLDAQKGMTNSGAQKSWNAIVGNIPGIETKLTNKKYVYRFDLHAFIGAYSEQPIHSKLALLAGIVASGPTNEEAAPWTMSTNMQDEFRSASAFRLDLLDPALMSMIPANQRAEPASGSVYEDILVFLSQMNLDKELSRRVHTVRTT